MNISVERKDDLNGIIRMYLTHEDYEGDIKKKLKELQKKVSLKGFRPGKVPPGLLKKMYGPTIIQEVINEKISQNLFDYIKDEELDIIGSPLTSNEQKQYDFQNDTEFEFVFDVGFRPNSGLSFDESLELKYYNIKLEDKHIEEFIEKQRKQFSKSIPVEKIESEDTMFRGTIAELDDNEQLVEDGILNENVLFSLKYFADDETKQKLIGAETNDVIVLNPAKTFENKTDLAAILDVPKEEVDEITADFSFEVTEIEEKKEAEMNEEFFMQAFGEDVKTEEQYREKVKEILRTDYEMGAGYQMLKDFKDKIKNDVEMKFPEDFLKRFLASNNKEITVAQIEKEFDEFLENFKWEVVKDELIKKFDIKVSDEELGSKVKQLLMAQFGITTSFPELDNYVETILQKEEEASRYISVIEEEKIIEKLRENTTLNKVDISKEEFDKMMNPPEEKKEADEKKEEVEEVEVVEEDGDPVSNEEVEDAIEIKDNK